MHRAFGRAVEWCCSSYPAIGGCPPHTHNLQLSDHMMEDNAYAFVTLKLASSWLAMRLDLLGLIILTGTGAWG